MGDLDALPEWGKALATILMAGGAAYAWFLGRFSDKAKKMVETAAPPPATILGASIITSQQIQDIVVQLSRNETALHHVEHVGQRTNELLSEILTETRKRKS